MTERVATNETMLVVGIGISGATAALDTAEHGKDGILLGKKPSTGDWVAQSTHTVV